MSRIRSIHPGIWTDETFAALSDAAARLILALGTLSDYDNKFPWDEQIIARHFGRDLGPELLELAQAGLIGKQGSVGEVLFGYGFRRRHVSKWERIRAFVFGRDGYACQYCGSTDGSLHCDHVVPVSRGGTNAFSNLTTACRDCNLSKGARLVSEWRQ